MLESELLPYVKASAAVLALPLDDEQVQRVALHLHHTARMARLLEGAELSPHDELAEIYTPRAFPPSPNMTK